MDYVADIKKYTDSVDEDIVASMEKTYRLVLSQADSAVVAHGDPAQPETLKKDFLIQKLGLSDGGRPRRPIAAGGGRVKGVSRKNRLTVYYLLAQQLGKLDALR